MAEPFEGDETMAAPHADATAGLDLPDRQHEQVRTPSLDFPPETIHLRDGRIVMLRAIRPDDSERLRAFHRRLTPDTVIYRFFHYMPELSEKEAFWFTHLDYDQRMAIVATSPSLSGESEEVIRGVGRYESLGGERAEVAFVVEDSWQGIGLGTRLLRRLADFARERGLRTLVAVTMASNVRMLNVFHHSGLPCTTTRHQGGEIGVELDLTAAGVDGDACGSKSDAPRPDRPVEHT